MQRRAWPAGQGPWVPLSVKVVSEAHFYFHPKTVVADELQITRSFKTM